MLGYSKCRNTASFQVTTLSVLESHFSYYSREYIINRSIRSGPVSLLANEFNVRSVLHGLVSLAAVNQICAIHEGMNGCKNLKIH